jgi:hypothetical protein
MAVKRYLYHCTTDYVGPLLHVRRCKPDVSKEPPTPRLCVAPSIAACLSARLFPDYKHIYVYRRLARGIKPTGVWDAFITGERWLIPPMHLAEFCCIPYYVVHELQDPLKKYFKLTKAKACNWKVRLACYALAAQTLGCVTKRR